MTTGSKQPEFVEYRDFIQKAVTRKGLRCVSVQSLGTLKPDYGKEYGVYTIQGRPDNGKILVQCPTFKGWRDDHWDALNTILAQAGFRLVRS